ncbi:MAG TPA: protein kinase [Solirubrobacterales bacterium]|nr:protein kinase [Solirubrobacterales bacterium]
MNEGGGHAGAHVAGYRVEELLGRGGTGEVYRATDARLGRPVALKVLAGVLAEDDRFGQRLLRESRLAASLDHPNVIPIYEAGEDEGRLFIAMRFVPGGDLKALLRAEGPLDPARAFPIFSQIADALDAAHRRGLVHRDVKPSNVLVDRDDGHEHCYLADFGLTQSAAHEGPANGQLQGTVDYISPEQIRGDTLDGRADQYSLACLMYECLTGRLPHEERSEVAALFAHLEQPVPPASEQGTGLPVAIDPVLGRGMAKDREERFESCSALVAAAREAVGLAPDQAGARRRRWLPGAAAVALAALAVIVIVLSGGGGGKAGAKPATGALVRVDPQSNEVVSRTTVRGYPGQLVVTPGGIWMADFRSGVLWRYQPGAGAPELITSDGEPRDLAALGDKVYVGADGRHLSGVVSTYDAITAERDDSIDLLACAMGSGEGVVWAAGCPFVQRLSTDDLPLRILHQVFLPFRSPATVENSRVQFRELGVGDGSLWVLGDALDRRLWRLDARTGRVEATIALGFPPTSVAVAGGAAWITDGLHDRVFPVDTSDNRVLAPLRVGAGASGVAAGAGSVWVANTIAGTLSRIDPRSRRVVATIAVGGLPRGVEVGRGSVWVSEYAG